MRFLFNLHPGVDVTVSIKGELASRGPIKVLRGGSVIGFVAGYKIVVEGAVHGKVKSHESVEVHSMGLVKGDVTANSLTVDEGGVLQGLCRIGVDDVRETDMSNKSGGETKPAVENSSSWFWQRRK